MPKISSFGIASTSSRELSRTSSHMHNRVKRQLARLAVDSYRYLETDVNIKYTGKKHGKLSGDFGEEDFIRYSTDPPILSLQNISYCQIRLEQMPTMNSGSLASSQNELKDLTGEEVTTNEAQEIQKMRGFINHEYLVLELQSDSNETLHILAEKNGGKNVAGIYVRKADPEEYDKQQVVLHVIDCGGVAMTLDSLQKLLLDADIQHYDLRDHNCWDYAIEATKRVLEECIAKVSDGDEAKKAQLKKAKKDLEANLNTQGIVNLWKKAVEGLLSRRDTQA